jgi:hypothetical protein
VTSAEKVDRTTAVDALDGLGPQDASAGYLHAEFRCAGDVPQVKQRPFAVSDLPGHTLGLLGLLLDQQILFFKASADRCAASAAWRCQAAASSAALVARSACSSALPS